MAIVFVTIRGEEHQVEYQQHANAGYCWYDYDFAEPTKFDPALTLDERLAIFAAIRDAATQND